MTPATVRDESDGEAKTRECYLDLDYIYYPIATDPLKGMSSTE